MSAVAITVASAVLPFPQRDLPLRPARESKQPEWILRSDSAGRAQWMNEAARELLGESPDVLSLLASSGRGRAVGSARVGDQRVWFGGAGDAPLVRRIQRVNRALAEVHRRTQEHHDALLRTHDSLDAQARHALRLEVIAAVESERGRIARELHDDTAQTLTGILLNLDLVAGQLGAASAEALSRLARSRELASLTLKQISRISHDLNPPDWGDVDFGQAIERLINEMVVGKELDVRVERIEVPPDASAGVKTTLYRILQEGLRNILRHSDARHVVIQAPASPEGVALVIEDDGRGFDPASQRRGAGIGLANMRKRAALLGGALEVSSAPGRGVRLTAFVPTGTCEMSRGPHARAAALGA